MFRVHCFGATQQEIIYLDHFPTQDDLPVWSLTCNIENVGTVQ